MTKPNRVLFRFLSVALSGLVLTVVAWQFLLFVRDLVSQPLSLVLWLDLVAIVPTYLLAIIAGVYLLRLDRRGSRFIWYAIALSFVGVAISFFWPVPCVPLLPVPTVLGVAGRASVLLVNACIGTAFAVATRCGNLEEASSMLGAGRRRLWAWAVGTGTLLVACAAIRHQVNRQMTELLGSAIRETNANARRVALEGAVARCAGSWQGRSAELMLAEHLRQSGQTDDAIAIFRGLLAAHFSDLVPSEDLRYQHDDGTRHFACLGLSSCFESERDLAVALHYARLANDEYPLLSWCGTCTGAEHEAVAKRIRQLESEIGSGG
jgi:hypothetical protein